MRLFIALELDYKNIIPLKEELKKVKGNFVDNNNLHLTLAFLGDVDIKKIDEIKEVINSLNLNENYLYSNYVTTFNKRTVVLKFKKNINLMNYQKELTKKLDEININYDKKDFIPHITLIRKSEEEIDFKYNKMFKIKAVHLFSSNLTIKGSIYESLYKKHLFFYKKIVE